MSEHTPGPWNYTVFAAHYEKPELRGWASSVYQDDDCHEDDICEMAYDFDKETVEANARLIAAAPLMYEFVRHHAENGDSDAQKIINKIN